MKIVGYKRAFAVAGEIGLKGLSVAVQVHRERDARDHPTATDGAAKVVDCRPDANGTAVRPAICAACATVTASSRSNGMRT